VTVSSASRLEIGSLADAGRALDTKRPTVGYLQPRDHMKDISGDGIVSLEVDWHKLFTPRPITSRPKSAPSLIRAIIPHAIIEIASKPTIL